MSKDQETKETKETKKAGKEKEKEVVLTETQVLKNQIKELKTELEETKNERMTARRKKTKAVNEVKKELEKVKKELKAAKEKSSFYFNRMREAQKNLNTIEEDVLNTFELTVDGLSNTHKALSVSARRINDRLKDFKINQRTIARSMDLGEEEEGE
jgi:uncharacterized protein (DUF3084 family)